MKKVGKDDLVYMILKAGLIFEEKLYIYIAVYKKLNEH